MPKQMASQTRFYKNWKSTRGSPSANSLAIRKLQRQVALNIPEVINFYQNLTVTPASAAWRNHNIDLTNNFVGSTNYRDDITGEQFRNKRLQINFTFPYSYYYVRIVLYRSHRPGAVLPLSNTETDFTRVFDPDAYTIYVDRQIAPFKAQNSHAQPRLNVNLKGLLTKFNSLNTTIEAGHLRMAVIHTGSTDPFSYGYEHAIQNK
jgi:hypothetical protein